MELNVFLQGKNHHVDKMNQALALLETPQMKRALEILGGEIRLSALAFILFSCVTAHKTYSWTDGVLNQQIEAVERLDNEFGHLQGGTARGFLKQAKKYYQQGLEDVDDQKDRPEQPTRMQRIRLVFFKDQIQSEFPDISVVDLHRVLSCFMSLCYPGKYETSETIRVQLYKMEKENWQIS